MFYRREQRLRSRGDKGYPERDAAGEFGARARALSEREERKVEDDLGAGPMHQWRRLPSSEYPRPRDLALSGMDEEFLPGFL